eukprot:TRINITY_DN11801_c0_g1_i2.p1 TRINITY_DN11801_c0_g1~~TRINITY_DN11801_c0_g1_i2.p1  ORF type:complete len:132 (-),score=27.58 TRINITY_DN11801_c0_g1_i2:301-696(-)
MSTHQRCIEYATQWVLKQGWDLTLYSICVSPLQSCPEGYLSVEVTHLPTIPGEGPLEPREQLRLSRLLEIKVETGEVGDVLAARDLQVLERVRKIEHAKAEVSRLQHQLETLEEQNRKGQIELDTPSASES